MELRDKQLSDAENLVEKLKAAVVDLEAAMERVELDLTERNTKIMLLQVTDPFSQANPYTFSYLPLYT